MPSSSLERLKQSRTVLTVTCAPEETADAARKALEILGKQVRIDGFRPGFAPEDKVRARVGEERLLEETVRQLLEKSLPAMLAEHGLMPVIAPKVEAIAKEPLTLRILVVERPQVTVKDSDKLSVEKKEPKADPKDVQRVLESVLAEHRTFTPADRAAQEGDQVVLKFDAVDDEGKAVPGLGADNYAVIIGGARLLPGFEPQLVGMEKGGKKEFPLELPEAYAVERLRGKTVTFRVECKRVEQVKTPVLDDAFAKEKLNAESADAFRGMVEQSILAQEQQFEGMRRERLLLDAIRENTQLDLAPELLEEEVRSLLEDLRLRLQEQGKTIEEWMTQEKKTPEQVMEELRGQALDRAKLRLGIGALMEERKIELTEEEKQQAILDALDTFPENKRDEARRELRPGSDLYVQAMWQSMVRKLLNGFLA